MSRVPIAIISLGCRFPGGVRTPEDLWRLLSEGVDAVGPVPQGRWETDAARSDPELPAYGAFLDRVDTFDAELFGVSPREARAMDPQQRLLLEVAWETLERASLRPDQAPPSTGVYVGMGLVDYARRTLLSSDPDRLDPWSGTGAFSSVAAGRLAYALGLQGPAMAVHTACSSSLVAVHLAVQALRAGQIDLALAGGANLLLSPEPSRYFSRLGALSADGRCRTFDASASGYGRGEGVGLIALMRLDQAQAEGRRVWALIEGSALNQDGRSNGLTAPSGRAQQAVIRAALADAGRTPAEVGAIEAHGTGTPLGDPIEMESLRAVYGEGSGALLVGSVKTNLGHLEAAAGIAGLMKAVLALQHRAIPAHLHLSQLNSRIRLEGSRLAIPTSLTPWEGPLRAGISAFGLAGTNAHLLLSAAPDETIPPPVPGPHLITVAGATPKAAIQLRDSLVPHAKSARLDRLARGSADRANLRYRIAVVAEEGQELARRLAVSQPHKASRRPTVAFAYTGQGAQHPKMAEAWEREPAFRHAFDEVNQLLQALRGRSLHEVIRHRDLHRTEWTQPAIFAVGWALTALWRSWGIEPDAVIGHSVGEVVAATVAGVLSLEDAVRLVEARGRLIGSLPEGGAMAAVRAGEAPVRAALGPGVEIVALNAPEETVIGGDEKAVEAALSRLSRYDHRLLRVSHAFHSAQMDPILDPFVDGLRELEFHAPTLPWITADGRLAGEEVTDPAWWGRQIREPVRFEAAARLLLDEVDGAILELGPAPVLTGLGAQIAPQTQWIPSLRRDRPASTTLREAAATLWLRGLPVSLPTLAPDVPPEPGLPTYPFAQTPHWIDPTPRPTPADPDLLRSTWVPVELTEAPQRGVVVGDEVAALALDLPFATPASIPKGAEVLLIWGEPRASALLLASLLPRHRVAVLTRGAVSVFSERPDPDQASAWGLGAVAALEAPERWVGILDVQGLGALEPEIVQRAWASLRTAGDRLALRAGPGEPRLHAERLIPARPTVHPVVVDTDGPWLITGGTGALGLAVARRLADRGVRHLVLISRSGRGSPEIDALRARDIRVDVAAVDVSDKQGLRDALQGLTLRGLVHCAGEARPRPLAQIDEAHLDRSWAAKVHGTAHLDALTRDHPLSSFIVVASIAGHWGSTGLSAYAAANRFAEAVVERRRAEGLPGLAIALGPLRGGMVDASSQDQFSRMGLTPLDPADVLDRIEALLGAPDPRFVFARVDWGRLGPILQARRPLSLLTDLPTSAEEPRATPAEAPPSPAPLDPAQVRQAVHQELAAVLGHPPDHRLPEDQGFFDAGLDSVMSVELIGRLRQRLGLSLPPTAAFDHPTPAALIAWIQGERAAPLQRSQSQPHEPIAIIGWSCRFPGADDPDALWSLMMSGEDAVGEVPRDRWDGAAWSRSDAPHPIATSAGGFLNGLDQFDPGFFGIHADEAAALDPQHRLILEVGWEALERAGIAPRSLKDSSTGVFVGIGRADYAAHLQPGAPETERAAPWAGTGNETSFAAGRLASLLGLRGPALSVNTACSSSLVAVHLAVQALRAGECDRALAGGVNAILDPYGSAWLTRIRALSPTGRCHTFDAEADGYVRSEGCGVIVLKRLSEAVADGDPVLAVIRGSAVSHDGATSGLTVPSGPAQQAVIRRALADAQVEAHEVDLVECHGTGTPLGDPIEVGALREVHADRDTPLHLTAVKAQIGHTETAAGIAGLLKAALAVQRGVLPGNPLLRRTNPQLPLDFPVHLATRSAPWPADRPRLAGVSAFGFSGTNAHLILQAPPEPQEIPPDPPGPHLLLWSGHTVAALDAARDTVAAHPHALPDLASTLAHARSPQRLREAVVVRAPEEVLPALEGPLQGEADAPLIALELPSAPLPDTVRQALRLEPAFAEAWDACVKLTALDAPGPLQLADAYAMGRLWDQVGLRPAAWLAQGAATLAVEVFEETRELGQALQAAAQVDPGAARTDRKDATLVMSCDPAQRPSPDTLACLDLRAPRLAWRTAVATLWTRGVSLHPERLVPKRPPLSLPTTRWQRSRHWIDGPYAAHAVPLQQIAWRPTAPTGDALGTLTPIAILGERPDLRRALLDRGLALTDDLSRAGLVIACPRRPGPLVEATEAALQLTRRWIRELLALPRRPRLTLLTRGALPLPGEEGDPASAALTGLLGVLALEHPELQAGLLDVDDTPAAQWIEALAHPSDRVRIQRGQALAPLLVPLESNPHPLQIPEDGAVLVTGGLGALGQQVGRWLHAQGAGQVVLLSRRPPPAAVEAQLAGLDRLVIRQADVADPEALDAALQDLLPIKGLIHCAGTAHNAWLHELQPDDLTQALRAKVRGGWLLHERLGDIPLFALFGSATAWLGLPGQAAYASANAFLDGLAAYRRAQGLQAVCVGFGPWRLGMAHQRDWASEGVTPLNEADGLSALTQALGDGPPSVIAIQADPAMFRRRYPGRVPALLGPKPNSTEEDESPWVQLLHSAPAHQRHSLLRARLGETIADLLGAEPDAQTGFFDAGMDSLMAVELARRVGELIGRALPATVAFDHPRLDLLTSHLLDVLELGRETSTHTTSPDTSEEPIAIVGMALRFPGADDPDALWTLLTEQRIAPGQVPPSRWQPEDANDPTSHGAFLDEIDLFDPDFFGLSHREATSMDPQQRLLLETAWRALEDAGCADATLSGSPTGIFVGITDRGYLRRFTDGTRPLYPDPWAGTGTEPSFAAGRISHALGLRGPAVALNTTCSSTLVALHLAAASLRAGECDRALAGAVSLQLDPEDTAYLHTLGALSPTGRCHSFSARADGYVRGEGCGIFVLARLSEAQARGDRILGILKGSAINHDGRASGLTVPSGPAQEQVIRAALDNAGVQPEQIRYLEAHGTGTPLGDPIEVRAAQAVYAADRPLALGAIKANLGHLELAAGAAGLAKVLLTFRHGIIPPQPGLDEPNPELPLDGMQIPTQPIPWPAGERPRLAALSAFGLSGTNAHLILQEPPTTQDPPQPTSPTPPLQLLCASVHQPALLADLAAEIPAGLPLRDLASDLHLRRPLAYRASVVAADLDTARAHLRAATPTHAGRPPRVALLFTGQGAQYAEMGLSLYPHLAPFREALDRCAAALAPHLDRPLLQVLAEPELLHHTRYTQPATVALSLAWASTWRHLGVHPEVVLGHSVGELSAAVWAGVLSEADALALSSARGELMGALPAGGGMAAILATEDTVERLLTGDVCVAAINAPEEVVISGSQGDLDAVIAAAAAAGIEARNLNVSHAFHSSRLHPMLSAWERTVAPVPLSPPSLPWITSLTGEEAGPEITTAAWWRRHAREPVRFADAIRTARARGINTFIEVGPHPVLCGMGQRTLPDAADLLWLPSSRRGVDGLQQLLQSVGKLWEHGGSVDLGRLSPTRPQRSIPQLPSPMDRRRFWLDGDRYTRSDTFEVRWEPLDTRLPLPPEIRLVLPNDPEIHTFADALTEALSARGVAVGSGAVIDLRPLLLDEDSPKTHAPLLTEILQSARQAEGPYWLVTRRGAPMDGQSQMGAATFWGASRSLFAERPDLRGGHLDLDALDVEGLLEGLATGEDVAIRQGLPYAPRLRPIHLSDPAPPLHGTWLLTGGLGSLGQRAAGWLADQGAARLILVGRTLPGPDDPRQAALEALRQRVELRLQAVDTADEEAMRRLLADERLTGVLHIAGITAPQTLDQLDAQTLQATLHPKVEGARVLDAVTRDQPIEHFVLYSSIAGVWGGRELAAYAGANAALDALAHRRRAEGLPGLSLNWGPWADGGMVDGPRAERLERMGQRLLPPTQALSLLGQALSAGHAQLLIARVDWPRFTALMEATGPRPLLDTFRRHKSPDPIPSKTSVLPRVSSTAPTAPPAPIEEIVLAHTRSVLRLKADRALPPDQQLMELGFDSLMATELKNALLTEGLDVPLGRLLGGPSVEEIVLMIEARRAQEAPSEPSTPLAESPNEQESVPGWLVWTHLAAAVVGAALMAGGMQLLGRLVFPELP